jgi:hypothetical protein
LSLSTSSNVTSLFAQAKPQTFLLPCARIDDSSESATMHILKVFRGFEEYNVDSKVAIEVEPCPCPTAVQTVKATTSCNTFVLGHNSHMTVLSFV